MAAGSGGGTVARIDPHPITTELMRLAPHVYGAALAASRDEDAAADVLERVLHAGSGRAPARPRSARRASYPAQRQHEALAGLRRDGTTGSRGGGAGAAGGLLGGRHRGDARGRPRRGEAEHVALSADGRQCRPSLSSLQITWLAVSTRRRASSACPSSALRTTECSSCPASAGSSCLGRPEREPPDRVDSHRGQQTGRAEQVSTSNRPWLGARFL